MKLSVVIPVFNEAPNIRRIYDELVAVFAGPLADLELEVLFLDNHSTDESPRLVEELIAQDPRVRLVRLSRNFGFQANVLTGYLAATGDAVVQLDADGEDDPRLIADFVTHWREGYEVVYGVRRTRKESFVLTLQRKLFYRVLSAVSTLPIPLDAGDFRLVDRRVVEVMRGFGEANPYLRGILAYSGFRQLGVPYDRRSRYAGESKFSWWDYFQLALDGITSFSRKPLALASWLGIGLAGLSVLGAIYYLVLWLEGGIPVQGFTTLIIVILLTSAMQLVSLGIIGAYVGRIFEEVKRRPVSIVEYEKRAPDEAAKK